MSSRYFTEKEVKNLIWDCEVDRIEGENRRWSRRVTSIVEADDGKFYKINWEQGLTENQENDYNAGEYPEVEKKTYEKTITVSEWVKVKDEDKDS
jgi:hypothetical protein